MFTDTFWDDPEHWFRLDVGTTYHGLTRAAWGPKNPPAGPPLGDPDWYINGLDWDKYQAGEYPDVPCVDVSPDVAAPLKLRLNSTFQATVYTVWPGALGLRLNVHSVVSNPAREVGPLALRFDVKAAAHRTAVVRLGLRWGLWGAGPDARRERVRARLRLRALVVNKAATGVVYFGRIRFRASALFDPAPKAKPVARWKWDSSIYAAFTPVVRPVAFLKVFAFAAAELIPNYAPLCPLKWKAIVGATFVPNLAPVGTLKVKATFAAAPGLATDFIGKTKYKAIIATAPDPLYKPLAPLKAKALITTVATIPTATLRNSSSSAGSTSATPSLPSGTVTGDSLLCYLTFTTSGSTFPPFTNWTLLDHGTAGPMTWALAFTTKAAGVTPQLNFATGTETTAFIQAFVGPHSVDNWQTAFGTSVSNITVPNTTFSGLNRLCFGFFSESMGWAGSSNPSGWSLVINLQTPDIPGVTQSVFKRTYTSGTGTGTATQSWISSSPGVIGTLVVIA